MTIYLWMLLSFVSYREDSDSSGFFLTKQDFINNRLQFYSPYQIKENHGPIWDVIGYQADGHYLKLKEPDGKTVKFKKGSVYGFVDDGVKYVYIQSMSKYLAMVSDLPPLYMLLREQGSGVYYRGYQPHHIVLAYTNSLDDPVKDFTKENIKADFARNPETKGRLLELLKKIDQDHILPHVYNRKQFIKLKMLIQEYMSSPNSQY